MDEIEFVTHRRCRHHRRRAVDGEAAMTTAIIVAVVVVLVLLARVYIRALDGMDDWDGDYD